MKGDLPDRTKKFAMRIVQMYVALPKSDVAKVLGHQALRSGTSVGAHVREAKRPRSKKDFVSKMEGALQELEESDYWLELLGDSGVVKPSRLVDLRTEINELIAIITTMIRRTKENM
jgi:four helix bundle protein